MSLGQTPPPTPEPSGPPDGPPAGFRHEALLYEGLDGFVRATSGFIREGLANEEPVLVVVSSTKIKLLKEELGEDAAAGVEFADMSDVGHNPARIIPAWYDFVSQRGTDGRYIRGIGEPISAERDPQALTECQRHESLLNLAFADASAWWLLCPYDTTALDARVIDEALASHPWVMRNGKTSTSPTYRDIDSVIEPFDIPLPEPMTPPIQIDVEVDSLDAIRHLVSRFSSECGLPLGKMTDLVLAVNEVTTNTLRHGGGSGVFRIWREPDSVVCEVIDSGTIPDPLVGRKKPKVGAEGGFGVWLVHQVCDLVQLRRFADQSVVRMRMTIPGQVN